MSEQEILTATYTDSMTVMRAALTEDAQGRDIQTRSAVYTGVPCAVSLGMRKDSSLPAINAAMERISMIVTLFHAPTIVLKAGDEVSAVRMGVTYTGRAEDTFLYPSHGETRMTVQRLP